MISELLAAVYPTNERVRAITPHLARAAARNEINSEARATMWLAQLAHESNDFVASEENLNYSAQRLAEVWPARFAVDTVEAQVPGAIHWVPNGLAFEIEKNPARIANVVYADRNGNGSEQSKDGYTYRGRGLIQLTGRANYTAAGVALGLPLLGHPEYAKEPATAAAIAGWFWNSKGCNQLADKGKFDAITRVINGGATGAAARKANLRKFEEALCRS